MGRRSGLAALTAASVVLIAACGSSASRSATRAAVPPASARASDLVLPARILVRGSSLGRIIVDSHGRTLYMFGADRAGRSACSGMCAHFWPPYTTTARPTAGPGINSSRLGVIHTAKGQSVVTYRGHPLYRFLEDQRPGQVSGENVTAFGGRWDVLSAAGIRITKRHTAPVSRHAAPPPAASATSTASPAATTTQAAPQPPTTTQAPAPPRTTTKAASPPPMPSSGSGIPQGGGGDGDLDNNGGPSDGDGNL